MRNLKLQAKKAPKKTGVYFFKNKQGKTLYVGKAANLKNRLSSYFNQELEPFRRELIFQAKKIDWQEEDSEIEALIKEVKLIKKLKPLFNVALRDDKNYFFIAITKENFSRIFITHRPRGDASARYIGPFTEGRPLKIALNVLRRIFPFRTCKNKFIKFCFHYHLGLCPAHGQKENENIVKKLYKENVKNLTLIFQGKKKQVLKNLKNDLKNEIKKEEFEKAAEIRDRINALESVLAHKKVIEDFKINNNLRIFKAENEFKKIFGEAVGKFFRIEGYDIAHFQGEASCGAMVVFENGQPKKSDYRIFKLKRTAKADDPGGIKEILERRFRHSEWPYPDLILIDGGQTQLAAALVVSLRMFNAKIPIIALSKNPRHRNRRGGEIYFSDFRKPIKIENLSAPLADLFLCVRDEAHRFVNSYHRKLRGKEFFKNDIRSVL
ncbi:MAG: GIY-YIG nuclease family protein [Parcubacteria group bacterium]|nr:GIY-YIG nuclease family protein [Parcubacteria group bacterium]